MESQKNKSGRPGNVLRVSFLSLGVAVVLLTVIIVLYFGVVIRG